MPMKKHNAKQRLARLEPIGTGEPMTHTLSVRCARCGFPSSLYSIDMLQRLGWKQSRGHPDYRYFICHPCIAMDQALLPEV